jgi:hypothetical protein
MNQNCLVHPSSFILVFSVRPRCRKLISLQRHTKDGWVRQSKNEAAFAIVLPKTERRTAGMAVPGSLLDRSSDQDNHSSQNEEYDDGRS